MKTNVIIRNGRIVDGMGSPSFRGDIGIEKEKIIAVGDLSKAEAEIEITAKGLIVCPGFVDIHTHTDTSFLVNNKADSKIMQGITTEVVGNCGGSPAPITELGKSFQSKSNRYKLIGWDWNTVAEYHDRLETKGLPVNVALLIGHGTVRASVIGYEAREPSSQELESMKSLVEEGMKEGAFGLSSGLKYAPGVYAKTDELIELCKIVKKYNGIYATHMRNQGDKLIESVDETIEIGEKSGVPIQIAHLKVKGRDNWGKAKNMLRIIDEAREKGIDVTFDQYPYRAGSTGSWTITPKWSREGGIESFLKRLRNPEERMKIEEEIPQQEDWTGSERIIIVKFDPDPSLEGKDLDEIGEMRGKSPQSVMCDLMLEAGSSIPTVHFYGWEEDVKEIMAHNAMMLGSDGSSLASYGELSKGKPHPRSYGAFTRFLGRYVLNEGVMSLEDGIRRMSSYPAQKMGILDRGILRIGMFADVVIFDPEKIIDAATYDNPHQYSKGIEYVFVNGTMAVMNGKLTGNLSGKVLKHTAYQ